MPKFTQEDPGKCLICALTGAFIICAVIALVLSLTSCAHIPNPYPEIKMIRADCQNSSMFNDRCFGIEKYLLPFGKTSSKPRYPEVQKHCNKISGNHITFTMYPNGQRPPRMTQLRVYITCHTVTELGDVRMMQFWYGEENGEPRLIRMELQTTVIDELRRNRR